MDKQSPQTPQDRVEIIRISLREGHQISEVAIPNWKAINDDVVMYQIVVSNKKAAWNVWRRYGKFVRLHHHLKDVCNTLKDPEVNLPPFPGKHMKMFIDHANSNFIEHRRTILENYLRYLVANPVLSYSESIIQFLTPQDDEVAMVLPPVGDELDGPALLGDFHADEENLEPNGQNPSSSHSGSRKSSTATDDSKDYEKYINSPTMPSSADFDSEDEITDVSIPKAMILKRDHVIFHINVCNTMKEEPFSQWTVLKRYGEFADFDMLLRKSLFMKPVLLNTVANLPPKFYKLVVDHLNPKFIEKRRILLENYLKRLVGTPELRRMDIVMEFLGVT